MLLASRDVSCTMVAALYCQNAWRVKFAIEAARNQWHYQGHVHVDPFDVFDVEFATFSGA